MSDITNTLYIIKGVCDSKESIVEAVNSLLKEKINFEIKFVDKNYHDILASIVVDSNRNTISDVDIIADVMDKFNRMWINNWSWNDYDEFLKKSWTDKDWNKKDDIKMKYQGKVAYKTVGKW